MVFQMVSSQGNIMFKIRKSHKLRSFYAEFKTRTQMQCTFHCKSSEQADCVSFEYNKAEGSCRLSKKWSVKSDGMDDPDTQVYQGRVKLLLFNCNK